jgi:hypothetical protein
MGRVPATEVELARSANWTIKNVPLETRLDAVRHARMAGLSVAEWVASAVRLKIAQQRAGEVITPDATGRALVVADGGKPVSDPEHEKALDALEKALDLSRRSSGYVWMALKVAYRRR